MPLFRCANCHRTFEAEYHYCAKCDINSLAEPRYSGIVQRLKTIHYDPPDPKVKGKGQGKYACNGRPVRGTEHEAATGEPGAVNCEACKATDAYQGVTGMIAIIDVVRGVKVAREGGCC